MKLRDCNVLWVDCQATGASPARGSLLEVAWRSGAETTSYLLQVSKVPRNIARITGITQKMVDAEGVEAEVVRGELLAAMESADLIVAHYKRFEESFFTDLLGEDFPETPWICTHALAKRLLPALPRKGIRAVAGYLGSTFDEAKRASDHVEATVLIWTRFLEMLEETALSPEDEDGIEDLELLNTFLTRKPPKAEKREYPLPRDKRLGLPDVPGVYRFLAADERVLYVGKASSLRARVNSYYRGKKGHAEKTLELVSLAFDVLVTPTESALEAAMLESELIKEHEPPYNRQQRTRDRSIVFVDREGLAVLREPGAQALGPYSSDWAVRDLSRLRQAMSGELRPDFLDWIEDREVVSEGVSGFCDLHQLTASVTSDRLFELADILHIEFLERAEVVVEEDAEPEEKAERVHTTEDVIRAAEWMLVALRRGAKRGEWLRKISNSTIQWQPHRSTARRELQVNELAVADVSTFDRMSTLLIELQRVVRDGRFLEIQTASETWTQDELRDEFREF